VVVFVAGLMSTDLFAAINDVLILSVVPEGALSDGCCGSHDVQP
jgi:hypothetical protein